MSTIDIVIADDHGLILSGIRSIIEEEKNWRIVAKVTDGRQAVEAAQKLHPHVAVLDVNMPELNGIEAARQIRKVSPGTEVLILTMLNSDAVIREALQAGVKGFLLKTDTPGLLKKAIAAVAEHKPFFSGIPSEVLLQGFGQPASPSAGISSLSPREREILQLIAESFTSKEIAAKLFISIKTVEVHRTNISRKLNTHSVAEMVRYAVRNDFVVDCPSLKISKNP